MCTLYAMRRAQDEMHKAFEVANDRDEIGNSNPQEAIFIDQTAPVVALSSEGRILTRMRWASRASSIAVKDPSQTSAT